MAPEGEARRGRKCLWGWPRKIGLAMASLSLHLALERIWLWVVRNGVRWREMRV